MAAYPGAAGFEYASVADGRGLSGATPPERKGYFSTRNWVKANKKTSAAYGPSYAMANDVQRTNRKRDKYYGAGRYRRKRRRRRRMYGRGAYGAAPIYRGQGGFFSDAVGRGGWLRKGGLDLVQTGLGNIPVVGGILGDAFGGIRKATGIGDYNIASNVLVEGNPSGRMPGSFEAPSFVNISDTGGIVISHREFIGNIYGPAKDQGFVTQKYKINPGIEKTFPWLSQIAANYQDYSIKQLIFSFKSTVSNFQTTTGVTGTVLSVTQHDPYAHDYEDKSEIMQAFGSVSCKATDNQVAGVECDPTKLTGDPIRHVRVAGLPDNRDPKEYDWGDFIFAMSDFPTELANANIGEIWVSYTVELLRPRVFTGLGNSITTSRHFLLPDSGSTGVPYADLGFETGMTLQPPGAAGQPWSPQGATILWDSALANNLFKNSQNSLAVKIESGTDNALSAMLGGAVRLMPAAWEPETDPAQPGVANPFNQKQLGASYGAPPLSWQLAAIGDSIAQAQLSPVTDHAGTIKITFPAAYSGRVKIKFCMQLDSHEATFTCDANCQGNITGIYDMISSHSQSANNTSDMFVGAPKANTAMCFSASGQNMSGDGSPTNTTTWPNTLPDNRTISEVTCELHCEVKAVTGGLDNFVLIRGIILVSNQNQGVFKRAKALQSTIEVTEYNASMDDKFDVPTIVNVQTGQRLVQDRSALFG